MGSLFDEINTYLRIVKVAKKKKQNRVLVITCNQHDYPKYKMFAQDVNSKEDYNVAVDKVHIIVSETLRPSFQYHIQFNFTNT